MESYLLARNNLQINLDSDSDMSDEEIGELWQVIIMRRKRVISSRPNFFDKFDDTDFRMRFRVSKETAYIVLEHIRVNITSRRNWNNAISAEQKLLLTLRFYATGCMLRTAADLCGVSISSASQIVALVSHHLALLKSAYFDFPKTAEQLEEIKKRFYLIARFPRVIGALDCTHVRILSPGGMDAELFRNRKGFFSINVQTICDSSLKILDVVARWPGSTHDATIFRNSRAKYRLESGEFRNGIIVADSGYENTNFVLTPLSSVNTAAENRYNESHIRTRNCVERQYGVWKRRFPVLSLGIRLNLKKIQSIIVATAILHNICCINRDIDAPPLEFQMEQAVRNVLNVPSAQSANSYSSGNNETRAALIRSYFDSLEQ